MAEHSNPGIPTEFCRNIATKRSFLSDEPPAVYLAQEESSTGYWCVRTMGAIGPDDDYVCPTSCVAGRSCFVSNIARPA